MVKFQILSDLHLEVGQQYSTFDIPACAPYLILAGDIGRLHDYDQLLDFLEIQCKRFTQVFMVLGNHEFYGLSWEQAHERALQLTKEPRLLNRFVLLNRRKFELPDQVVLLGCTLWSQIEPKSELRVRSKVKDFTRIEGWSVQRHKEEYHKDVQWLREEVQNTRDSQLGIDQLAQRKKIIVVTHHAPIREGSSRPEHLQNPWTDAFATELLEENSTQSSDQMTTVNPLTTVDWWLFGHTHFTTECHRGLVKLVSNQRGYCFPWQAENAAQDNTEQSGILRAMRSNKQRRTWMSGLSTFFQSGDRKNRQTTVLHVDPHSDGSNISTAHSFDVRKVIEV